MIALRLQGDPAMQTPDAVLDFWFVSHGGKDWWGASPEFDRAIAEQFGDTHRHVARGEAFPWRTTPLGRLAEIIVLDQFSRQLYRNSPLAFAQDGMALVLAQEAVASGFDQKLDIEQRGFLYMPFMHSESSIVQQSALPLFEALGDNDFARSAPAHIACIERFGRFPKRNAALGRTSTPEELAYLAEIGNRMF
jgi:uncharacterized protein (DUF924 family)